MNGLDGLPDDATVTVRVGWLRKVLAGDSDHSDSPEHPTTPLTVSQVAAQVGRSESTVRSWLHSGDLEGFKLQGREWRIRPEAVDAFFHQQETDDEDDDADPEAVDLSSWRDEEAA